MSEVTIDPIQVRIWRPGERAKLGDKEVRVDHSWPKRGSGKFYLVSEVGDDKPHQVIGDQLSEVDDVHTSN